MALIADSMSCRDLACSVELPCSILMTALKLAALEIPIKRNNSFSKYFIPLLGLGCTRIKQAVCRQGACSYLISGSHLNALHGNMVTPKHIAAFNELSRILTATTRPSSCQPLVQGQHSPSEEHSHQALYQEPSSTLRARRCASCGCTAGLNENHAHKALSKAPPHQPSGILQKYQSHKHEPQDCSLRFDDDDLKIGAILAERTGPKGALLSKVRWQSTLLLKQHAPLLDSEGHGGTYSKLHGPEVSAVYWHVDWLNVWEPEKAMHNQPESAAPFQAYIPMVAMKQAGMIMRSDLQLTNLQKQGHAHKPPNHQS